MDCSRFTFHQLAYHRRPLGHPRTFVEQSGKLPKRHEVDLAQLKPQVFEPLENLRERALGLLISEKFQRSRHRQAPSRLAAQLRLLTAIGVCRVEPLQHRSHEPGIRNV